MDFKHCLDVFKLPWDFCKGRMYLISEGFVAFYSLMESIGDVRSINKEVHELTASIIVKPPDINVP